MKIIFPSFFIVFFVFSNLFAQSSVWSVSDGKRTMYLAGTVHVLRSSDFPLPPEFESAYARSDYVVFETDLSGTQSESFGRILASKMFLPENQSLSKLLLPSTYARLEKYLIEQGIDIRKFDRLQPWAVVLTLTQLKLNELGIDQNGVDAYYSTHAAMERKEQRYLESPYEQIDVITRIGQGEEDAMILQTIEEMNTVSQMMDTLVTEWRRGETERIENELVLTMKKESPMTYNHLLKERNDAWMRKLEKWMDQDKRGLVLVGAMHLAGPDGLLKQFHSRGYRVESFLMQK